MAQSYARFAALVVRRYGPEGTFWAENPTVRKVPVREWQILNEVNHTFYWNVPGSDPNNIDNTGSAQGYVDLLRVTRAAIKSVDRRARIVHAGTDSKAWRYLRAIYRAGGRRQFDVFAVHPFTDVPHNVITILRYVRREMNRNGDRRKADVRHRVVMALLPGPGRRSGQAEPHPRRPGARDHRDPEAARALAPASAAEQGLLLQLAVRADQGRALHLRGAALAGQQEPGLAQAGSDRLRALVAGLRGLSPQVRHLGDALPQAPALTSDDSPVPTM